MSQAPPMRDADYMQRALALAAPMAGRTGENPAVGCVIVRNDVVIGEGVTGEGGRPHGEENALRGIEARGATAYITLEPCAARSSGALSCSDLLIQAGIARAVIAARDPHPKAAGAGIARMRAAGIVVELGLMELEARAQNAAFFAKWDQT